MSFISFNTPLTTEEQIYFGEEFKKLDNEQLGVVTGESIKSLFNRSGLSAQLLSQIWGMCDYDNKGFLDISQFSAAMRMIGHLQTNPLSAITSELYQTAPSKLASFKVKRRSLSSNSTTNGNKIPMVSSHDIAKFSQLFDRSTEGSLLSGTKAKEIFLKAKLPTSVLGSIWSLCDRNNSGSLTKVEFIIAMHLIQLTLSNSASVNPLPYSVPSYLWNLVLPSTSNIDSPLSVTSTGISGKYTPVQGLSINTFSGVSDDWVLTVEKKKQFDSIFDSLDKERKGTLSSTALVPFFLTSKLKQDVLATIWDLADINNNSEFSKVEFAIAMFLIQKKNSGVELPNVVPDKLLQSPSLNLYSELQYVPELKQLAPSIPSENIKPNFNDSQTIHTSSTSKGSLNDLLTLGPSFTPLQLGNSLNTGSASPISLHSTTTGLKQFKPSSTFGQSIIKEDKKIQQQSNLQKHVTEQTNLINPSLSNEPEARIYIPDNNTVKESSAPVISSLPSLKDLSDGDNGVVFDSGISLNHLSIITTELRNLFNQANSLTTQAGFLNDKKVKSGNELGKLSDLKVNIELKLNELHKLYDQETKQTDNMEKLLIQSRIDVESLQQQLSMLESNYHALQTKSMQIQQELQEVKGTNAQLNAQISKFNNISSLLKEELREKQELIKKEKSMANVNSKQYEVSQNMADNLKSEIADLEQHLNIFINKRKELDEYQVSVEKQHSELQNKHRALVQKSMELKQRDLDIQQHAKEIEGKEQAYEAQLIRLQSLLHEINTQEASYKQASYNLQIQHAQEAEIRLERPIDSDVNVISNNTQGFIENVSESHPVGSIEFTSFQNSDSSDDVNKIKEDITSKDSIEQVSAIEAGKTDSESYPLSIITDKHLSECNIHKLGSPVSLAARNEVGTPDVVGQKELENMELKHAVENQKDINHELDNTHMDFIDTETPIRWSPTAIQHYSNSKDDVSLEDHVFENKSIIPLSENFVNEEFPPIQNLHIEETDSSDEDISEVHDTHSLTDSPSRSLPSKAVFDDEFIGLEPAASEGENELSSFNGIGTMEGFETIEHQDLDEELQQGGFTGTTQPTFSTDKESIPIGNDEWDDVFAGFGNSTSEIKGDLELFPTINTSPSINRGIATTPKSLAIEELSSMGFTQQEAIDSLEKCNWDLEAATNHLLDHT